jgi:glycosyltransferase involved in cell wall biosynthesis
MSTIFLSTSINSSAVSQYFQSLAKELVKRGHRVVLLVNNQKYHLVDENSNPAVLTWPSPRPVFLQDALFLNKVIKQYHPECVIGNFSSDNVCTIVGWLNKVPHRWVWYHTMSRAIDMESLLPRWQIHLLRFRKRLVYRLNTQVISVSLAAAADLRKTYGLNQNKTFLSLHCLLLDPLLSMNKSEIEADSIICVGRLAKFKGQETLLRAVKAILKLRPTVKVYFIGDGPDRLYFENLALYLGIKKNCHFEGNISYQEVLYKMASAAVCVVPSYSDALGMVNIESLSVGTPVVASDVDGMPEVILDQKVGFLFPPGNSEILAEKILEILNNSTLCQAYSVAAREHFLQNFSYSSLPKQVDQLENILAG